MRLPMAPEVRTLTRSIFPTFRPGPASRKAGTIWFVVLTMTALGFSLTAMTFDSGYRPLISSENLRRSSSERFELAR